MIRRTVLVATLVALLILLALCSSGSSLSSTQTQPEGLQNGSFPQSISPTATDDDGVYEFGVDWINDYPGSGSDLWLCDDDANYMDTKLSGKGWTKRFKKGNWDTSEDHFDTKEEDYLDKADLVMFRGHGGKTWDLYYLKELYGPVFTWKDWFGGQYTDKLTPGEVRRDYGDKDAEWIALGGCKTLSDSKGAYWASAMDKAHLILGWDTNADHAKYGTTWINEMVSDGASDPAKTVKDAWFSAADATQSQGRVARVIGENTNCGNDYIWGQGTGPISDPTVDNYYTYWDHTVNDQGPNLASIAQSMTLYMVVPKTITEDYVIQIGEKFGISGPVENYGDGIYYMSTGPKWLKVSEIEGIQYGDSSKLWIPVDRDIILPSLTDATMIAMNFLASTGLMPPDAMLRETIYNDNQTAADKDNGEIINSTYTDVQVLLGRERDGFSIIGPGGRLKVYVGEAGDIIGFLNVWREVVPAGTVDIFGPEEAIRLLTTYGSKVALNGVPAADQLNVAQTTLAYYEDSFGSGQTYLIPAYACLTDVIINQTVDSTTWIYVPAAAEFVPPIASIASPTDNATFTYGSIIDFTGNVTEYGYPPFGYQWFSDIDGYLGAGSSISTQLSAGYHSITLEVTDNNGNTGWDTITVNVVYVGDFDRDFDVDYDDIVYFVDAYIKYWSGLGKDPKCDMDNDCDIDYDDILIFVTAYIDYWTP